MGVNISDNWTDMFVQNVQRVQDEAGMHPAPGLSRDAVDNLRWFEAWIKEQIT